MSVTRLVFSQGALQSINFVPWSAHKILKRPYRRIRSSDLDFEIFSMLMIVSSQLIQIPDSYIPGTMSHGKGISFLVWLNLF